MTLTSWWPKLGAGSADGDTRHWRAAVLFALGLCLATGGLVWFSYVATRQWQRGTGLLEERRAAEALALAHAALIRDMKGAWINFLVPTDHTALEDDPPYKLLHRSAQIFARFPYVEAVFIWKGDGTPVQTSAFTRSDRRPPWDRGEHHEDSFPVVMTRDSLPFGPVIARAREADTTSGPFALLETSIDGVPYQIVAHLIFGPGPKHQVIRLVALAINLQWVRQHYFQPILSQIASIGGVNDSVVFSVSDDAGVVLASTGTAPPANDDDLEARFSFAFLEATVLHAGGLPRPNIREFVVRVQRLPSASGRAAVTGAFRILLLIAVAAIASVFALLQTVRAVRASVTLALLKSEFVAAVTHELKTPLVTIRLVGDTLARGRYASPEAIQEYAYLLSKEATNLSQSIDHLLTYAHYSEAMPPTAFALIDVGDMVDDAADHVRPAAGERDGEIVVDIDRALPQVRVDVKAVTQALEIVLDNAIKYSTDRPQITVRAVHEPPFVRVTVADRGIGIHPDDLAHVRERFFRGRNAHTNGSGLGLSIAQRILTHHGGQLHIRSELGGGTQVDLLLRT